MLLLSIGLFYLYESRISLLVFKKTAKNCEQEENLSEFETVLEGRLVCCYWRRAETNFFSARVCSVYIIFLWFWCNLSFDIRIIHLK